MRWKLVPALNGVTSTRLPYGFHKIEPLPNLPDIERATKILHKLASDPGVVAVMKSRNFSIDCLTELYPKGKVRVVPLLSRLMCWSKEDIEFAVIALFGSNDMPCFGLLLNRSVVVQSV